MTTPASTETFVHGELVAAEGPLAGRRFALIGGDISIGRDPKSLIALVGDPDASRRHARLTRRADGGWRLEDVGSSNGTYVNRRRIAGPVSLRAGDRVTIGASVLEFSPDADPEQTRITDPEQTQIHEPAESDDADQLMAASKAALVEQQYAAALAAFEQVIAVRPDSPDGHYGAGVALLLLKRLEPARARLFAALERDAGHVEARYHLGLVAEDQGDPAEAERHYRAALSVNPGHRLARRQLERLFRHSPPRAAEAHDVSRAAAPPQANGHRRTLADDLDAAASPVDPETATRGRLLVDARRRVSSYGGRWLCAALAVAGAAALTGAAARIDRLDHTAGIDQVGPANDVVSLLPAIVLAGAGVLVVSIFLSAALTRYRIYERRIDFHTGVLNRRQSTLWLYDVTDVDFERSLMLILAGTGAIALQSEARKVPRSRLLRAAGQTTDDNIDRIIGIASAGKMEQYADQVRALVLHERRKMI